MAHLGLSADFWHGRRVLVTGHTGFKGSWLSLWLQSLGAEVYGFSLPPPTTPSLFEAARVAEGINHTLGDLRDAAQIDATVRSVQPEMVFHLAAQAIVHDGYRDPTGTLASNVMGTVHLLEALRAVGSARALLVVTSDKCYHNQEWLWPYRENEAMGGRDPYSVSKGCVELLTAAWRDSFFHPHTPVATARAGNVIGGGDWAPARLIPDALRAWEGGNTLTIRSPHAVRPWQHVLDCLAGYLILAERLLAGEAAEAWNFGPQEADMLSVVDMLQRLASLWGDGAGWQTAAGAHPHEATLLRLDSSHARNRLKWQTRYDSQAALERVVSWHRAWLNNEDMRAFSQAQIADYLSLDRSSP